MEATHWQSRRINHTNNLVEDFEAAILQQEPVSLVYSRLITLSSLVDPGLNIDGQGTIEFPIPVQDTIFPLANCSEPKDEIQWEIDSKHVTFDNNPIWEFFLRDVMAKYDANESTVENGVKYEFRKLVLFDSSSSYLPHSSYADDEDNSGILLLFLPSKSPSRDPWPQPNYWAGISKPPEYKLAVYYKLTFLSRTTFSNVLYAEDYLRRVLVRWDKGKYPSEDETYPLTPYLVYRLSRNYDLNNGKPVLADEDQQITSFIDRVSDELDFILCLGYYHHCVGYYFTSKSIRCIIDINGDNVIKRKYFWPTWTRVGNPLVSTEEAVVDHSCNSGDVSLIVSEDFDCTVMVLFRAQEVYRTDFFHHTIVELVQELVSISDGPPKKVKRMAKYIINLLKKFIFVSGIDALASMIEFALTKLDLELWNKAINVTLENPRYDIICDRQDVLLQSLQVLGFENVRSGFDQILNHAPFGHLYSFLSGILSNTALGDDTDTVHTWCDERLKLGLRGFGVDKDVNVPHFIAVAQDHGIHYLLEIRPSKHHDGPFLFVNEFIRTLQIKKADILGSKSNDHFDFVRATAILQDQGYKLSVSSSEHAIDILIDRWLSEAISDLERLRENTDCFSHYSDFIELYFHYPPWYNVHEDLVSKSLDCIELCIISGHIDRCSAILDTIEGLNGHAGHEHTKLQVGIIPLVRRLCLLLQSMQTDISSPPFAPFLQHVIESYVRCFLGTRTWNPQETYLRQKIDIQSKCECKMCTEIKEFMHQLYVPRRHFPGSRAALLHIGFKTMDFYELADIFQVDGPKAAVRVTKRKEIFSMQRWENRIKHLQELLRCIGPEEMIEKIMGNKYCNLKTAMEGKGDFLLESGVVA